MSNQIASQLTALIERARKVLHYEQRGNHQDKVVTGGLELFVVHWAEEASAICKDAGLDVKPIYRFTEHLESYRRQDPMQRAASLRAALSILNEVASNEPDKQVVEPERESVEPVKPGRPQGPLLPNTEKEKPQAARPVAPDKKESSPVRPAQRAPENPIHLDAGMTSNHASLTL